MAWHQQQRIADTGPGNRLPEDTNPTIVFKDGELRMENYRGYFVGIQRDPVGGTLHGVTSMYANGAMVGF